MCSIRQSILSYPSSVYTNFGRKRERDKEGGKNIRKKKKGGGDLIYVFCGNQEIGSSNTYKKAKIILFG